MLTTARPASSYRAVASAVRTRLLDARENDTPVRPYDGMVGARINTVRDLLELGSKYGPAPNKALDAIGSPAKLDLARELSKLAPKHLKPYSDKKNFSMPDWVNEAGALLTKLKNGFIWSELSEREREFTEDELLPFLQELLSSGPRPPRW